MPTHTEHHTTCPAIKSALTVRTNILIGYRHAQHQKNTCIASMLRTAASNHRTASSHCITSSLQHCCVHQLHFTAQATLERQMHTLPWRPSQHASTGTGCSPTTAPPTQPPPPTAFGVLLPPRLLTTQPTRSVPAAHRIHEMLTQE